MDQQNLLLLEIDNLHSQLAEALEALDAIRSGRVDALVVYGEDGEKIYTLEGADQPYRVMVEAINEGAATLSESGVVLWANARLAEMLKAPLETIFGSPVSQWIAPEDHKAFEALLIKSRQEKCRGEVDLQAGDRQVIPVLLSLSPVTTPSQVGICIVATDLTEQKNNIEITAAERMAKAIIEQAAESIVVCDQAGVITRASQAAHRLAGQNPLFKPFEAVFPLTFDTHSQAGQPFSLQAVLNGASFQGVEAILERSPESPPGSQNSLPFSLQISAKALSMPGERNLGCIITMTDVTGLKQVEQAAREYAQQLERSNRELEEFASVASHDLQEPLRKVQSFGRLLEARHYPDLDEEAFDFIRRMQEAAGRMEKMINDLLAYARVSTKVQPLEQVDLAEIARGALVDLESRIQQTGGRVEVGELPKIEADPLQMHLLLQNLLSNALKFHKPGEPPAVKIYARLPSNDGNRRPARSSHPEIEIVVEDNGVGFDMKHLERIFQPFQRLHGRSEYEGSGIGLSICRKIVERYHGRISAESKPNMGAKFTISLPVKQNVSL